MRERAPHEFRSLGPALLERVPLGWKGLRNAALFTERDERGEPSLPILQVSIAHGVQVRIFSGTKVEQQAEDPATYKVARAGDIVFNKMRFWQGAVGVSPCDGLVSPDYTVATPNSFISARFAMYLFKTSAYMAEIDKASRGIVKDRNRLYWEEFRAIYAGFPDRSEQDTIANFLDRETARIDALIAKQEELIERIEEKRRAVINHAVTRGLDPNVPMKDSGVPWIGEVPKDWKVMPLRHALLTIEQGWCPQAEDRPAGDDEWGVLKAGCVNNGIFRHTKHKALPKNLSPRPELEVRIGDLLMSRASGSPDLIGSTAYVEACSGRLMISDKLFRLHVRPSLIQSHLLAFTLGCSTSRYQIMRAINGAEGLANNITQATVRSLMIAVPPLNDQENLLRLLLKTSKQCARGVAGAGKFIKVLRERRAALITAAVTGQIDAANRIAAEAEAA